MKTFNTKAICVPSENYMVDLTDKILEIKKLVDLCKYFTINRARQYGNLKVVKYLLKTLY